VILIHDIALLHRSIAGVRGFSRETIVALAANIESREWRRKYLTEQNLPPEHSRVNTIDDVECSFSVLRDSVGKDFILKKINLQFHFVLYLKFVL